MPFGTSADTSVVALEIVPEVTFAVIPVTPAMDALRTTGETFKQTTSTDRENELRGDRQPGFITRTNAAASGDSNHLLSYTALDRLIEAALFSANWTTPVSILSGDLTVAIANLTVAPNVPGLVGSASDFAAVSPGDVVQIGQVDGFTVSPLANNGLFRVLSVETGDGELRLQGLTTLVIEANPGGSGVDVDIPSFAENGVERRSHTIRRRYTDIATVSVFRGMAIDAWNLQVNAQGNVESNFTWIGKDESSTDIAGATVVPAAAFKPFSGVDNVQGILENGEVVELRDVSFALANGIRERNIIGVLGPNDLGASTLALSGGLEFFYDAGREAIYDRYLGFQSSRLAILMSDAAGQGYWFDIGDINFNDGQRNAAQGDDDVLGTLSWEANRETLTDRTFRVYRTTGIPVA